MLPDQLFYNTGIFTYIWLLRNDKPASHAGRVMLIDARQQFEKEPKSFGNKRHRITDSHRAWIEERYNKGWAKGYTDEQVKIFPREDFAYHKVSVVFWQTDEHDQPAIVTEAYEKAFTAANVKKEQDFHESDLTFRVVARLSKVAKPKTIEFTIKARDNAARLWYLRATARFGWSRNVLLNQIKAGSYERAVTEKKTHNFDLALPEHFAEQADEMLKSSYSLDFLGLRRAGPKARLYSSLGQRPRYSIRRQLRAESPIHLWRHRTGIGRAFSRRASLSGIPGALPQAGMGCTFGARNIGLASYLRSKANPIGVAAYELQSKLPGELKGKLPTVKQLADVVRVEMEGGKWREGNERPARSPTNLLHRSSR